MLMDTHTHTHTHTPILLHFVTRHKKVPTTGLDVFRCNFASLAGWAALSTDLVLCAVARVRCTAYLWPVQIPR